MLERNGRILAPAGKIWSVVILSSTFKISSPSNVLGKGLFIGSGLILGPRIISTFSG